MRPTARDLRHPLLGASAAAMLAVLAAGCETAPPGAGFTNPAPGESAGRDKPSDRTDLSVPDANAGRDKPLAEAVGSVPPIGPATAAGQPGKEEPAKDVRQTSPETATSPPAKPPSNESSGKAQEGSKSDK
jgi:hypothetical protein